jgi:hypothetical protein
MSFAAGNSAGAALSCTEEAGMAVIKPQFWINVPDRSELHVKAKGTTDNFNIEMVVDSSGNDDAVVNHEKIVAGATIPVRAPRHYAITVRITFAGTTAPTVTFDAFIKTPSGKQHGSKYSFQVKDPKRSPYRALIGIVTVGGGSQ